MSRCGRFQEEGAALVLVIAIGAVAVLAWQHRGSLMQLLMAQQVLDRSVSAAALAAAQHHARLLNGHAYLNRTVMAHQVAMAHLMTIASVEKMRLEMSRRVTIGNPPLFLIGMMFGPSHAAAYAASRLSAAGNTRRGLHQLHEAFVQHDRLLDTELARARLTLRQGVEIKTRQIVREVLVRNMSKQHGATVDLNIDVQLPEQSQWPRVSSGAQDVWRNWFKKVIEANPYLGERRKTARNWWMISKGCPHMRHELRRRGESTFDAQGLWQVTDTLSFHAARGHKVYLCFWREYPMGWSNVISNLDREQKVSDHDRIYEREGAAPRNFSKVGFVKWITAQYSITALLYGLNNVLADGYGYESHLRWRSHHRVAPYLLRNAKPLETRVTVRQPLASLNDPLLRLGLRVKAMLQIHSNWPESLTARSAAHAYYDRFQARKDKKTEFPNLFQPFWLAKNIVWK